MMHAKGESRRTFFTRRATGLLFLLLLVAALGCKRSGDRPGERGSSEQPSSTGNVVARVDGNPIVVEDVRTAGLPGRAAGREQLVEAAITRRLAVDEARRRGFDKTKEVQSRIDAVRREARAKEEAVLRNALLQSLRDGLEISEADLRAHYEKTQSRYFERQIKLRREVFPSKAEAEAAMARLGPEARLDPTKSEAIGPAPMQDLPKTVLPEAYRLRKAGDRVLVEKEGRFAILELAEVLPAVPLPFEAVRDRVKKSLRTLLASEAYRALLKKRRVEAKIEIDRNVLADDSLWNKAAEPLRGRMIPGRPTH
jgi:hypothetical protein